MKRTISKRKKGYIRKGVKYYSHLILDEEVYQLPYKEGKYLLYAPLKRLLFVVNGDVINLLLDIKENKLVSKAKNIRKIISTFVKSGILIRRKKLKQYKPMKFQKSEEFLPTGVTLFLTSDCNLRCVYCYSSGGSTKHYLSFKAARAAIDFIIDNALKLDRDNIFVGFHGGGEPTLAWDTLCKIVEYTKAKVSKNNLKDLRLMLDMLDSMGVTGFRPGVVLPVGYALDYLSPEEYIPSWMIIEQIIEWKKDNPNSNLDVIIPKLENNRTLLVEVILFINKKESVNLNRIIKKNTRTWF